MARMPSPSWTLPAILLLVACGGGGGDTSPGGDAAGEGNPPTAATASGPLFDRSVGDLSCEVLTPELVSGVLGVPAAELRQTSVMGACNYRWSGGTAGMTSLRVFDDVPRAVRFFEDSNREMSPEEVARAMEAIGEEMERRTATGEVTREQAEIGREVAAGAGAAAATARLEVVEGVGDRALYDGTARSTTLPGAGTITTVASQATVVLTNALFTVEVNAWRADGAEARAAGPPPEARARNRELTLALARAVVTELGKHR
jgi:hypothetical protein